MLNIQEKGLCWALEKGEDASPKWAAHAADMTQTAV